MELVSVMVLYEFILVGYFMIRKWKNMKKVQNFEISVIPGLKMESICNQSEFAD